MNLIVGMLMSLASIDSIVTIPELGTAYVGLYIQDLGTDSIIHEQNGKQLFIPASNMKIITTAASLFYCGPDFRFKTICATRGEIKNRRLRGDILLVGGGDPTLSLDNLKQFAQTLQAQGVNEITGNIIVVDDYFQDVAFIDNSFRYERLPVGWAWHYLDARYAAEISALSVNDNCVTVQMRATKPGSRAAVRLEPETDYVTLKSAMITKAGDDSIVIYRLPDNNTIYVGGGIGSGHARDIQVAIRDPARFAGHCFRQYLRETNIALRGTVVKIGDMEKPRAGIGAPHTIDSVVSAPLIDILRETDVESVNLYAEMLLKTLGAHFYNEGSFYAGIQMVKRFLDVCGVDTNTVSVWDGSGLSRHNLVAPADLARVLNCMYHNEHTALFYELFPVAGEGTLANRFSEFRDILRAKTGALHAVSCLSGYLDMPETDYCFVMMFNNFTCKREVIEKTQELILRALVEYHRSKYTK